jgi:DNA-binding LacI/PurR family transcriptional regulator
MSSERINVRKIAKDAGVSIATVSRVLNGKSGVTEENRKKVHALLLKYNYVLDSHLSKGRKIAVLCGSTALGSYQSGLLEGIFSYSVKNSLNTVLIFKNSAPHMTALEQVREQQCAGVIIDMPHVFADELDALADSEVPVVLTDDSVQRSGMGYVNHGAYDGSLEAARYLISLGHRRIGYIEYGIRTSNHIQRYQAYCDAMSETGINAPPEWHALTPLHTPQWDGAYKATQKLLKIAPELTAVMTSNDNLAAGVIKAVFDSGRRIPDDVSVIGFDNYPYTEYLRPALTTVHHPVHEIGYMAAQGINRYFKNPRDGSLPRITLPTRMILRDSVRALT